MTSFRFISPRSAVLVSAVLVAALSRLIPHPPNVAPITAMALFGAASLSDRRLAFLAPLVALGAIMPAADPGDAVDHQHEQRARPKRRGQRCAPLDVDRGRGLPS